MTDLNTRVRERLREEKARLKLSERDIAGLIQWTQSRVAQKLSGRTPLTIDELDALCFALSLTPTEAVRDRGMEFCAEMTPTEMRVLETYRRLLPVQRDALLQMMQIAQAEAKRALPPKKPIKIRA